MSRFITYHNRIQSKVKTWLLCLGNYSLGKIISWRYGYMNVSRFSLMINVGLEKDKHIEENDISYQCYRKIVTVKVLKMCNCYVMYYNEHE